MVFKNRKLDGYFQQFESHPHPFRNFSCNVFMPFTSIISPATVSETNYYPWFPEAAVTHQGLVNCQPGKLLAFPGNYSGSEQTTTSSRLTTTAHYHGFFR